MQNPLAKFVPHLIGEYPKKFLNLFEGVSIVHGFEKDEIRDLLWQAYEFSSTHHEGQKRKSGEFSSGQPNVEKGHNPLENQVSKTSSSCCISTE